MKRLACLAALFLSLTLGTTAQNSFNYDNPQVKTLIQAGPSSQRIDLVFVGDGYTASQSKELERDARDACDSLFSYPLFKDYRQYFNAHLVIVPSIKEGNRTRYAFGSEREEARGMVMLKDKDKVFEVARKAPDCDVVICMTTVPGRAHAGDMVVLPTRDFSPLCHELGHIIGGLGDEYDSRAMLNDRRPLPVGQDLDYPNLTLPNYIDPANQASIRKTAKWGHFLDLPGAFPLVGAVQGGFYQSVGVWRPTYSCIMGADGAPFCPVCHEAMVKAIYAKCGMKFDDAAYHRRHPLSQWR